MRSRPTSPRQEIIPAQQESCLWPRTSACAGSGRTTTFVKDLASLFALGFDDDLATFPNLVDAGLQSGRAASFVAADLIATISAVRPDAEVRAFLLGDTILAQKLKWPKPVSLLLSERYVPAFRTIGGRERVRPGEE